jgi:hypothetical protein
MAALFGLFSLKRPLASTLPTVERAIRSISLYEESITRRSATGLIHPPGARGKFRECWKSFGCGCTVTLLSEALANWVLAFRPARSQ